MVPDFKSQLTMARACQHVWLEQALTARMAYHNIKTFDVLGSGELDGIHPTAKEPLVFSLAFL
jgi:hypothetical protein